MISYFCFLAVILSVRSASAPFISPCRSADNACALVSAQAAVPYVAPGIPALGVPSLDPLRLKRVVSDQSGLQLTITDTLVTGMRGCSVDAIKFDVSKGKQAITIRCSVKLEGDYTLGGRLILLPVQGAGRYTIDIRDIIIKAYTEIMSVEGADGKPHWHIDKWHHTYQVRTSTVFKFENLFNGNKLLAEPIDQFLNTNWRDVMQEVAPPIVRAIVAGVVEGVEALYKAVPAEQLYIQ